MERKRKRPDGVSPYSIMWLVVMFDLPVENQREQRLATQFRNSLLELGFFRKQFSVQSVLPLKKGKCEAAAQRRPAQSERKNRAFSAKRQAVWFEMRSISN